MRLLSTQRIKRILVRLINWSLDLGPINKFFNNRTLDTTGLKSLARSNGELYVYSPSYGRDFNSIQCIDSIPQEIEDKNGKYDFEEGFVTVVEDIKLLGDKAIPIMSNGKFILDNALTSKRQLIQILFKMTVNGNIFNDLFDEPENHFDMAVSLVGPWDTGYYHWFTEYLPRLKGIDKYNTKTGTTPQILIPSNPPDWLTDSLELMGYNNYRELPAGSVRVNSLVVPSLVRGYPSNDTNEGFINSTRGHRWVASKVKDYNSFSLNGKNKLYISRNKAADRKLVNENEVMGLLEERGFNRIYLEDLPLKEQIKMMANAEIIIGPHGAGLTNMIFGKDMIIIELFGKYVNACYYTMAQAMGHEYACIQGNPKGDNMYIETTKLKRTLDIVS